MFAFFKKSFILPTLVGMVSAVFAFAFGYMHGQADGVLSATSVTATQVRLALDKLPENGNDLARQELLRVGDQALMVNAEIYRLGPVFTGFLVSRSANFEVMGRYARFRLDGKVASINESPAVAAAARTFVK